MRTPNTDGDNSMKQALRAELELLLKMVDNGCVVRSAEELRKAEVDIVARTDAIAGNLIEAIVARSIQDETVVTEEGRNLAKSGPRRMKNHGKRDVVIQPYRGNPFSIRTTYYCRAGLSPKKGDKKGGSIQS